MTDARYHEELLPDLTSAVETQHGGRAIFVQAMSVRETFQGNCVWEGVVHVFDLEGHPNATSAYAWSSPIEANEKRRCFSLGRSNRRWMPCGRRSWRSIDLERRRKGRRL